MPRTRVKRETPIRMISWRQKEESRARSSLKMTLMTRTRSASKSLMLLTTPQEPLFFLSLKLVTFFLFASNFIGMEKTRTAKGRHAVMVSRSNGRASKVEIANSGQSSLEKTLHGAQYWGGGILLATTLCKSTIMHVRVS